MRIVRVIVPDIVSLAFLQVCTVQRRSGRSVLASCSRSARAHFTSAEQASGASEQVA